MFTVVIPHPLEGEMPIEFQTEDRSIARYASIIAKAMGVEAVVTVELEAKTVKFKGLD